MAARLCMARMLALVRVTIWVGGCSSVLTEGTSAGAGIIGAGASRAITHNAGVTMASAWP